MKWLIIIAIWFVLSFILAFIWGSFVRFGRCNSSIIKKNEKN